MSFDLNKLHEKKCVVLGFGVSNKPLVEFLLLHGAEVEVRDKSEFSKLGEAALKYKEKGVSFITGDDYLTNISGDLIFRSPGIRPDIGDIPKALENGGILTSEMELFFELCPCPIIAITGSDGKTTSSTLTAKLLEATGKKVYLGGNIGTPLLQYVEEMGENDIVVLELSSFQLMTFSSSADVAGITNISPNHLDWHTDMDEYISSKANIFKHKGNRKLVLNKLDGQSKYYASMASGEIEYFSAKADADITLKDGIIYYRGKEIMTKDDILIPGIHNIENYMTAIALTSDFGVNAENIKHVARTFGGVEHRLEFVRELDGVKYYNSSIDSSPSRTEAALSALSQKPIIICGGYDKHIPFAPLAKALGKYAKAVVLTGATADSIHSSIKEEDIDIDVFVEYDFDSAVDKAREISEKGDIILLSPSCASFDRFKNFAERGIYFKNKVNGYK